MIWQYKNYGARPRPYALRAGSACAPARSLRSLAFLSLRGLLSATAQNSGETLPVGLPPSPLTGCVGRPMATFHALGVVPNPSAGYYDPALPTVGVRSTTRPNVAARGGFAQLSGVDPKPTAAYGLVFWGAPTPEISRCNFITVAAACHCAFRRTAASRWSARVPLPALSFPLSGPQLPDAPRGLRPQSGSRGYAPPLFCRLRRPLSSAACLRHRPFVPLRALRPFASASPPRPQSVWVGSASPSGGSRRRLSN